MLVRFTDMDLNGSPMYIEADLVRAIVNVSMSANPSTAIFQQDSETPFRVREGIVDVLRMIREGKSDASATGTDQ